MLITYNMYLCYINPFGLLWLGKTFKDDTFTEGGPILSAVYPPYECRALHAHTGTWNCCLNKAQRCRDYNRVHHHYIFTLCQRS